MLRSHSRCIGKSAAFSSYCITYRVIPEVLATSEIRWMSISRANICVSVLVRNNSRFSNNDSLRGTAQRRRVVWHDICRR